MASDFQILWKAGDRTWANYREVAHLNMLDQYCELMGVKNAAELPPNYVNEDSESEDEENIITLVNSCEVREENIRNEERGNRLPIPLLFSTNSTNSTSYLAMEGFTAEEIQQCSSYELGLRASANGVRHQFWTVQLPRWEEYLDLIYSRDRHQAPVHAIYPPPPPYPTHHTYPPHHSYPHYASYQPIPAPSTQSNTISMPSEALETIIRAIRRPSEPVHPRVVTCVVRHPTPMYNYQGRGTYRGRGSYRGRGRRPSPNHRGRRSDREDNGINIGRIPIRDNLIGQATSGNQPGPSNVPSDPVQLTAKDLVFLDDITNERGNKAVETGEDVPMEGNNEEFNI